MKEAAGEQRHASEAKQIQQEGRHTRTQGLLKSSAGQLQTTEAMCERVQRELVGLQVQHRKCLADLATSQSGLLDANQAVLVLRRERDGWADGAKAARQQLTLRETEVGVLRGKLAEEQEALIEETARAREAVGQVDTFRVDLENEASKAASLGRIVDYLGHGDVMVDGGGGGGVTSYDSRRGRGGGIGGVKVGVTGWGGARDGVGGAGGSMSSLGSFTAGLGGHIVGGGIGGGAGGGGGVGGGLYGAELNEMDGCSQGGELYRHVLSPSAMPLGGRGAAPYVLSPPASPFRSFTSHTSQATLDRLLGPLP